MIPFRSVCLVVASIALLSGCDISRAREADVIALAHDGLDRMYRLYVPESAKGTDSPLLLVLHGGGPRGSEVMEWLTGFNRIADEFGFVVVYPEGWDAKWNDGRIGRVPDVDDVGFLRAVVDDVASREAIDRTRVFASGVSNGGMMCHRLACEAGDLFAGIAPVIANFPEDLAEFCQPEFAMPVVAFNGTEDIAVPYEGGYVFGRERNGAVLSAAETMEFLRSANGCDSASQVRRLLDTDPSDGSSVSVETWECEATGAPLALYTLEGAEHSWPGAPRGGLFGGTPNRDIDASRVIWEFFSNL